MSMNANEFYVKFGREECARIAQEAGTTIEYFEQLIYGQRRPSFDLAEKLCAASSGRMDTLSLMRRWKRAPKQPDSTPPDAA